MTDRTPLRDYGKSRAVLIGTSAYQVLEHVPAARSLQRMAGLLASDLCGWPADLVTRISNPRRPGNLHQRLIKAFRDVTEVALFYYVGHGQVDDADRLCLGLVESSDEHDLRASTSLEFDDVRDALIRSPAATKILILDCCSSGLANERRNTMGTATDLADKTAGTGAYTMAACQPYGTAMFETDVPRPQTYFTKYLVDVVKSGIPGQPTGLQLHQIFLCVSEALVADGHPRPVERNIDHASEFVLAYNAAPVQVEVDVPTALHFLDRRVAQLESLATGGAAQPAAVAALPAGLAEVRGSGTHGAAEQQIGTLKASAARFLRERRGEAFRQVEAELQQLGASARPTAILQTTAGDITIQLLPDYAPQTVRNFIDLAEGSRQGTDPHLRQERRTGTGLYDGTIFHRVVPGFMIQGGDPFGSGFGGPGYVLADEFHADLSFDRPYLVAMANTGPNTNGSQFFITVAPAPWLTARHTIFAVVIAGQDVVDEISRMPTARDNRPLEPVRLQTVRVSGDLAGG